MTAPKPTEADPLALTSAPDDTPAVAVAVEALYRCMLLIRRFEERVYRLFLEGEIPGTLHQYHGQEAVAVGVCDV